MSASCRRVCRVPSIPAISSPCTRKQRLKPSGMPHPLQRPLKQSLTWAQGAPVKVMRV